MSDQLPLSHMTGLEQRLLARCRAAGLGPKDRVVVGFSGGGDSLALAAALGRLKDRGIGPEPRLVHVDHRLRPGSAAEAEASGRLAGALGLAMELRALAEGALARHSGVGLEEAARRERYRALSDAARLTGARAVALAHHRDDQAETVLLHLLRGAGTSGAAGMAEWGERPVPWWPGEPPGEPVAVWRPFLSEPRAALRDFVAALGLAPVHDPTNDETRLARNAVRHAVLPAIERAFPGAAVALARHADLAATDDAALEEIAGAALDRARDAGNGLPRAALAGQPLAIRRRVVRGWLRAGAPAAEPGMDRIAAVLEALERNRGGARIEIGNGFAVTVRDGVARIGGTGDEA